MEEFMASEANCWKLGAVLSAEVLELFSDHKMNIICALLQDIDLKLAKVNPKTNLNLQSSACGVFSMWYSIGRLWAGESHDVKVWMLSCVALVLYWSTGRLS